MFRSEKPDHRTRKVSSAAGVTVALILVLTSPIGKAQGTKGQPTTTAPLSSQQAEEMRAKPAANRKVGVEIANPGAAGGLDPSILATLRSQKAATDAEQREILAQTLLADGFVRPSGSPDGSRGTTATNGPRQANPNAGSQVKTSAIHPHCLVSGISTVSNKVSGALFTPMPDWNLYTIKGCGFGNEPGNIYLKGAFKAGRIPLQVLRNKDPNHPTSIWTENAIVTSLYPGLSGESDQALVTLVIEPASGAPMEKTGFTFLAAREEVLLQRIPLSAVTLALSDSLPKSPKAYVPYKPNVPIFEFSSPVSDNPQATQLGSVYVKRDAYQYLPGGSDYYDFSSLNFGFVPAKMKVDIYNGTLPDPMPGKWDGRNIRVFWNPRYWGCDDLDPMNCTGYESEYALSVWVVGPRGVEPWKPDPGKPVVPRPANKPHP